MNDVEFSAIIFCLIMLVLGIGSYIGLVSAGNKFLREAIDQSRNTMREANAYHDEVRAYHHEIAALKKRLIKQFNEGHASF